MPRWSPSIGSVKENRSPNCHAWAAVWVPTHLRQLFLASVPSYETAHTCAFASPTYTTCDGNCLSGLINTQLRLGSGDNHMLTLQMALLGAGVSHNALFGEMCQLLLGVAAPAAAFVIPLLLIRMGACSATGWCSAIAGSFFLGTSLSRASSHLLCIKDSPPCVSITYQRVTKVINARSVSLACVWACSSPEGCSAVLLSEHSRCHIVCADLCDDANLIAVECICLHPGCVFILSIFLSYLSSSLYLHFARHVRDAC